MKELIFSLISRSPLRRMWQVGEDHLRVLTYHKVDDAAGFEWQMEYLVNHYRVISPEMLDRHLHHGEKLPARSVLITFDDAEPSVYDHALPTLESLRLPALLFVVTSLPSTQTPFWWDEVLYYAPEDAAAGRRKRLANLKRLANPERMAEIERLREESKKPRLRSRQLSWEQLHQLDRAGVRIANHTHTHPLLDRCDEEVVRDEVSTAMHLLQKKGFTYSQYFAYPNGNNSDATRAILQELDCKVAFLYNHQVNAVHIDALAISRLSVNPSMPRAQFKLVVEGVHSRIMDLRQAKR